MARGTGRAIRPDDMGKRAFAQDLQTRHALAEQERVRQQQRRAYQRFRNEFLDPSQPLSDFSKAYLFQQIFGRSYPVTTVAHYRSEKVTRIATYAGLEIERTSVSIVERKQAMLQAAGFGQPAEDNDIPLLVRMIEPGIMNIVRRLLAMSENVNPADPEKIISLGGGYPPEALLVSCFEDILLPAIERLRQDGTPEEKRMLLQYPQTGGPTIHRRMVAERYLAPDVLQVLRQRFGDQVEQGVVLTNGSQEILYDFAHAIVEGTDATKENPAEIVVINPTYLGWNSAIEPLLKDGRLRINMVGVDQAGRIDVAALEKIYQQRPNCRALYIAAGNPNGASFTNLDQVAAVIKKYNVLTLEDDAYEDLGQPGTQADKLITKAPDQVIRAVTFSKKFVPGLRLGVLHFAMRIDQEKDEQTQRTGRPLDASARVRSYFLQQQQRVSLGVTPWSSGAVYAALKYFPERVVEHIRVTQQEYARKRALFLTSYQEYLDQAFGQGQYTASNLVQVGLGMFGWRSTGNIHSEQWMQAAASIGLFEVPGTSSVVKREFVVMDESHSDTEYRMRLNFTNAPDEFLREAVRRDVIVQAVLNRDFTAARRLFREHERQEIRDFVDQVEANGIEAYLASRS